MPDQKPYLPMCRHGVVPALEFQHVAVGTALIETYIRGRVDLVYDCPTPSECAHKAQQYLIDAGIEPPD